MKNYRIALLKLHVQGAIQNALSFLLRPLGLRVINRHYLAILQEIAHEAYYGSDDEEREV